jgi:hypothetical protein
MQSNRCDSLSIRRTVGPEGWRLRHVHMARAMIGLAVVVILTAMLPGSAGAQEGPTFLGQHCWALNPFIDTLRMSVTQAPGEGDLFELNIRWRAMGGNAAGGAGATYQLLGTGTGTTSITDPNSIEFAFGAVQNTPAFGGNPSCDFFAVISIFTLNGTWATLCTGGTTPFTTQGTLTFASPCPTSND